MKSRKTTMPSRQSDSPIFQNSIPKKMFIACVLSCILGIVLMAVTSHYLLLAAFICVLICTGVAASLFWAGKISIAAACLAPMLLLCFVYTPLSWFTFDGPLGCTPYLSLLFITVISLTYYGRIQILILSLYGTLLLGLTVHWRAAWPDRAETAASILTAYILTAALTVFIIEGVKRKNLATHKHMTDLSLRDDLTGLLNRRAIREIFVELENAYSQTAVEYSAIMIDIDKFKSINDLFGHNLGDSVLKSIAASIRSSIRSEDKAFRFGGDEFLLILPDVNAETARQICARIEEDLDKIQGYAFPLTISIGCALRSEGASSAEILALADQRMYETKRSKSNEEGDAESSPSGQRPVNPSAF